MKMKLLGTAILSSAMAFGAAGMAQADDFPTKPVTMVIGWGAGGSTDIQGRVLADILSEELGQPVNVVNQPGAGGGVALARLANSRDEGYTFVFGTSMTITFGPLSSETTYELDDFRYVAGVTLGQSAIVTGEDRPFGDSWEELVEYARENPGMSYATQTALDRMIIEYIAQQEGLELRIVPTSGGAGMAPLILSGDVDFAYSGGTHSGYAETGEMPVLLSLAEDRLVAFPDAPTLPEAGYDINAAEIRVAMVPKNTPDAHVERLAEALEAATQDPRFIEITEERILMPVTYIAEDEVTQTLRDQVEGYQALIEELGGLPGEE
ncbi:tripartite tricarboxylate transporter substrate binding protein [Billgrantia desiderata]|uniref:Tripartite tricarboxylate transporter substrate binding protein n=1 Tax=Billgrantia desiderata TaxID=52021 RepID=A0AAW4YW61_9GAMM|nr:tripartite tricarboxylate transporter substrate binding protein [Halomonas desiderata]MCE8011896.1 tripartite tricarboxylate transporter substrate binding protein [Halomonas desiderata]MCE8044156.1 tripartite tricarboxylate transporter substrate binding protein [Halomonas desiderata]MCE8048730.1 tripartite tricarboxylate transporter substrate binding protein [Halomonas desiderata]MCE8052023.1 tripartite tricarboxylate transporter substrate binding protein [Halomonas desiderata]NIC38575.1 tr